MSDADGRDVVTDEPILLQTRVKPPDEDYVPVRVWQSTHGALVVIKAKMELSSMESTSIAQVIDALAQALEKTRIKVEDEEEV